MKVIELPATTAEAREFAGQWCGKREAGSGSFLIGRCNFDTRPATIYAEPSGKHAG